MVGKGNCTTGMVKESINLPYLLLQCLHHKTDLPT